jgi:hypothetical protein
MMGRLIRSRVDKLLHGKVKKNIAIEPCQYRFGFTLCYLHLTNGPTATNLFFYKKREYIDIPFFKLHNTSETLTTHTHSSL